MATNSSNHHFISSLKVCSISEPQLDFSNTDSHACKFTPNVTLTINTLIYTNAYKLTLCGVYFLEITFWCKTLEWMESI